MTTTLYIWRVKGINIPRAIFHIATDRFVLKKQMSITFFKSLGTGSGETFTPTDADTQQWALLVVGDSAPEPLLKKWRSFARSEEVISLSPIASTGSWSKHEPFIVDEELAWQGEVAAITRARIKWRQNWHFWRAVPPVTASLKASPGLIKAIGIGEAPIGLQGTFSIWKDAKSIRDFAYKSASHQAAISATAQRQWYAEELFARFAVTQRLQSNLDQMRQN